MAPVTANCPTPDGCNAESECLNPGKPMRLRVLHLPSNQFVLVLDRVPESLYDSDHGREILKNFGEHSKERLTGCGGVLGFSDAIDMEAWYPYG